MRIIRHCLKTIKLIFEFNLNNMLFITLSIFSSCTLLWLFRYFSDKNLHIAGIITFNYITCFIWTLIVNKNNIEFSTFNSDPWNYYAIIMGGLFIITFNIMSKSVTHFGIMISSVSQKMSLIAPILVGIIFYNENITIIRVLGIFLAITAIFVINMPFNNQSANKGQIRFILYPVLTWALSSIIDSVFYVIGKNTGKDQSSLFLSTLFGSAAFLGLGFLLISRFKEKEKIPMHIFPYGILLGTLNFSSIHFLMKAISQGWEASVMFPINNVGIIAISMIGALLLFKEPTNKYKYLGVALAISAVLMITLF